MSRNIGNTGAGRARGEGGAGTERAWAPAFCKGLGPFPLLLAKARRGLWQHGLSEPTSPSSSSWSFWPQVTGLAACLSTRGLQGLTPGDIQSFRRRGGVLAVDNSPAVG